jgi:hypothetical protein
MRHGPRPSFLALAFFALACEGPRGDAARAPGAAPVVAAASAAARPAALDSTVVQDLADWPSLEAHLPMRADSAAAALERYRQAHGLPLEFFVRPNAPKPLLARVHTEQEEMCGGDFATAFVRRMPTTHAVLSVSEVAELDSAGRELRRWPLPRDVEFGEVVAGVHGDELVTAYQQRGREGIYLRVRPDGAFRVSAEPPQPFPLEKWIEVEDSVFLRVEPRDDGPFYTYPSGARPEPVGTWEPKGDSDLYVRTDSGPKRGTVARAVVRKDWSPGPRMLACPAGGAYEGMICRGFPDGARERRIAAPAPCT